MKLQKKTRRTLRDTTQVLQRAYDVLTIDKSRMALATGAFALGGLVAGLARDPVVRAHSRSLAIAVIDRMIALIDDERAARSPKRLRH